MTNANRDAFRAGQFVGSLPNCGAAMCPYLHDHPKLRRAWMDGFSRGRIELAKQEGSAPSG